ncbi:MAG: hypothetical protein DMG73_10555 [Acidobacteria bacterium]|nr:MAG: hypothetical protein DMG73_10555 [Acidobacteriota bacterium]
MPLDELHPFNDAEIANIPAKRGVYVLYQLQNPLDANGSGNLRTAVIRAKAGLPNATHFAVEILDVSASALRARVRKLRQEMTQVRSAGVRRDAKVRA